MKSQRGNVIVYALVGLVLFGVLLGSIWWVRQRSNPAPVATNDQTQQQTTDTEVKQDEKPAEQPAEGSTGTGSTNTNQPQAGQPQRGNDTAAPRAPESQTPRTGPSAVAASGPLENALVTSLVLGAATFAGTSYARSRR